jgi:hypothetical protein
VVEFPEGICDCLLHEKEELMVDGGLLISF